MPAEGSEDPFHTPLCHTVHTLAKSPQILENSRSEADRLLALGHTNSESPVGWLTGQNVWSDALPIPCGSRRRVNSKRNPPPAKSPVKLPALRHHEA